MIAVSYTVTSNVQDYNLDFYHWTHMYPSENVYLKIALLLLLFSCDIVSNSLEIIWIATHQSPLSSVSWSLLKLISFELVMLSNHLILCYPLLLPSNFPSIRVFSNELSISIRCQSIGASASVLPMNIQDWFPLGLTDLIRLQSKRLSRVFSNTTVQKHQFFSSQLSSQSNSHIHTLGLGLPK